MKRLFALMVIVLMVLSTVALGQDGAGDGSGGVTTPVTENNIIIQVDGKLAEDVEYKGTFATGSEIPLVTLANDDPLNPGDADYTQTSVAVIGNELVNLGFTEGTIPFDTTKTVSTSFTAEQLQLSYSESVNVYVLISFTGEGKVPVNLWYKLILYNGVYVAPEPEPIAEPEPEVTPGPETTTTTPKPTETVSRGTSRYEPRVQDDIKQFLEAPKEEIVAGTLRVVADKTTGVLRVANENNVGLEVYTVFTLMTGPAEKYVTSDTLVSRLGPFAFFVNPLTVVPDAENGMPIDVVFDRFNIDDLQIPNVDFDQSQIDEFKELLKEVLKKLEEAKEKKSGECEYTSTLSKIITCDNWKDDSIIATLKSAFPDDPLNFESKDGTSVSVEGNEATCRIEVVTCGDNCGEKSDCPKFDKSSINPEFTRLLEACAGSIEEQCADTNPDFDESTKLSTACVLKCNPTQVPAKPETVAGPTGPSGLPPDSGAPEVEPGELFDWEGLEFGAFDSPKMSPVRPEAGAEGEEGVKKKAGECETSAGGMQEIKCSDWVDDSVPGRLEGASDAARNIPGATVQSTISVSRTLPISGATANFNFDLEKGTGTCAVSSGNKCGEPCEQDASKCSSAVVEERAIGGMEECAEFLKAACNIVDGWTQGDPTPDEGDISVSKACPEVCVETEAPEEPAGGSGEETEGPEELTGVEDEGGISDEDLPPGWSRPVPRFEDTKYPKIGECQIDPTVGTVTVSCKEGWTSAYLKIMIETAESSRVENVAGANWIYYTFDDLPVSTPDNKPIGSVGSELIKTGDGSHVGHCKVEVNKCPNKECSSAAVCQMLADSIAKQAVDQCKAKYPQDMCKGGYEVSEPDFTGSCPEECVPGGSGGTDETKPVEQPVPQPQPEPEPEPVPSVTAGVCKCEVRMQRHFMCKDNDSGTTGPTDDGYAPGLVNKLINDANKKAGPKPNFGFPWENQAQPQFPTGTSFWYLWTDETANLGLDTGKVRQYHVASGSSQLGGPTDLFGAGYAFFAFKGDLGACDPEDENADNECFMACYNMAVDAVNGCAEKKKEQCPPPSKWTTADLIGVNAEGEQLSNPLNGAKADCVEVPAGSVQPGVVDSTPDPDPPVQMTVMP